MDRITPLPILAASFLTFSLGCSTDTAPTKTASTVTQESSSAGDASRNAVDDPAKYKFHRNAEFADVTKNMPEGSVDHIDLNMAAKPNVIVVVTVTALPKDGLRFATTFTGPNHLKIVKDWTPAEKSDQNEHVGLFVLPDAINSGSTVVR